jgi:hypothetical protein
VMMLRRCLATGVALCAGVLPLTACAGRDGPLSTPSPHAWAIGRQLGATFTDGLETLEFGGSEPAELVSVRMVGDRQLELVGVGLAGPGRKYGSIQLMEGFPPRHPDLDPDVVVSDAAGHSMAAQTRSDIGWQLLLGIRVTEPGRHVRTGIEVTYTVAGETYVELIPAALAVCASRADTHPRGCALPDLPG